MSEPLYRCPCCNKLVTAGHFRRQPWSKEDLAELLSHPQLRKVVMAIVREVLTGMPQPELPHRSGARGLRKEVPPGYTTYSEACGILDMSEQTLRTYISQGKIKGGKGLVMRVDLETFASRYKARSHTRK